ncbi:PEP-CTERM sorting domain-containing protein [Methylophilus luteus]|uniref:PEP-CTERM sorting domain-containing protein n=1 Tax=Methylophilus luteus TaxID=640108 RepID=A0ABW3F4Y9_9PROT
MNRQPLARMGYIKIMPLNNKIVVNKNFEEKAMFKQWLKIALIPAFAFAGTSYAGSPLNYGLNQERVTVSRAPSQLGSFSFLEIFTLDLTDANYITATVTEDKRFSVYDIVDNSLNLGLYFNNQLIALNDNTLYGPGAYEIRVNGVATGSAGGQFFLNYNVSTTAVPEPSSALFMMLGLGLLGVVSVRKSKSL